MKTLTALTVDLWVRAQIFAQGSLDPVINADPSAPEKLIDPTAKIIGFLKFFGFVACVAGIIMAGASMALGARLGDGDRKLNAVGWSVVGAFIVGASGIIAGFALELASS